MAKLNNERIEQLLRTAHEVDRLDDELSHGPSGGHRVVLRRIGWGTGVAIAAGLAIVATISLTQRATTTPTRAGEQASAPKTAPIDRGATEIAQRPITPESPTPETTEGRSGVLLAIVGHADGSLRCVNWSANPFQGRALSELRDDELKSMAMAMQCFNPAERLLVVGVEGPANRLPMSDERAIELARCVLASPGCEDGSFNPGVCATTSCLAADVSVRVKSVAMLP